MPPAGSDQDDGYGDLAQKSAQLLIGDGSDAPPLAPRKRRSRDDLSRDNDPYTGTYDDGDSDPGDDCRAAGHCTATVRPAAPRSRYTAITGLTGAIEGTVRWHGPPPAPVVTACGQIAHPSVRVAASRAVGGVLVYLEHVELGRALPSYGRPAGVGGVVAKRGCTLAPTLQIVAPLPAAIAIHGDTRDAALRVTTPGGAQSFALQPAGRIRLRAQPGVTRVEADDGTLGAAWIVAADTPYYAITDDSGRFRIDELAAGSYDVTFWRPALPRVVGGALVYGPPVITRRTVTVDPARPARLDVALER